MHHCGTFFHGRQRNSQLTRFRLLLLLNDTSQPSSLLRQSLVSHHATTTMAAMHTLLLLLSLLLAQWSPSPADAASLLFGQSAVFSGTNRELGADMRNGIMTAFQQVNDQGGINGRLLELESIDDQYDPTNATVAVKQLIADQVLALTGSVGTPTANAMLPYIQAARLPMVGAFTGARTLRTPYQPYVLNVRASYDDELASLVNYAIGKGYTRFSILYQDDSYGTAGFNALDVSLKNKGLFMHSSATYVRNTVDVAPAVQILQAKIRPEVCVMIGTARALAAFVTQIRVANSSSPTTVGSGPGQGWTDVLFHTVSFVGAEVFAKELQLANSSLANIVVTQTMPPPRNLAQLNADAVTFNDSSLLNPFSLLYQFATAMNQINPANAVTFGSLEGYLTGRVIIDVLTRFGPITPQSVKSYIQQGQFFDTSLVGLVQNQTDALTYINNFLANTPNAPFALNVSVIAPWVRDQFMRTAYTTGVFIEGGLELGPLQAQASCNILTNGKYLDSCLASADAVPCNQLAFNVYLSEIQTQSAAGLSSFVYREIVPARLSWSSCNSHSNYIPDSKRPFIFGQTAVFSGVAADLGTQVRRGIQAAFRSANLSPTGGVRQRPLLLVSYDDGYTPDQAVANVKDMFASQPVFALLGVTGTAPAVAIYNSGLLANATGASTVAPLALMGSYTGTRTLRSPFKRNVINFRSGYDDELAAQMNLLLSRKAKPVIYLFRQDDSFGDAGQNALLLAARFHLLNVTCTASYVRNTDNITDGLMKLQQCATTTGMPPDAIVLIGTALPLANFVDACEDSEWRSRNLIYTTVSFVGTEAFKDALPTDVDLTDRVFVSEVVPPLAATAQNIAAYPILQSFLTSLAAYDSKPATYGAFEGYVVGRLAYFGLDRALSDTPQAFTESFYTGSVINIDSLMLGPFLDKATTTSPVCNQGSATVYTVAVPSLLPAQQPFADGNTTCGVLSLYSDSKCAPGSAKKYADLSVSLANTCQPCNPGFYNTDGLECLECAAGFFSSQPGSTTCEGCDPSRYQSLPGQNSCPTCCDSGYSHYTNATICTLCEDNAFTDMNGASSSSQCICKPGFYAANNMTGELTFRLDPEPLHRSQSGKLIPYDSIYLNCQACPNKRWAERGQDCMLPPLAILTEARSAMAALSGVGIFATIISTMMLIYYRGVPLVKASSPLLMLVLQLGCILAFLVPILGAHYPSNTSTCLAQLYLGHLSWTCLFGSAALKCYRLRIIFLMGSKRLKKVTITDAMLLRRVAMMLAAQIIYISVWISVAPVESTLSDNGDKTFEWCAVRSGGSSLWSALLLAWDAFLLLYGVWLCVTIRSFKGVWNESKQLGVVAYNTALIAGVALIAVYTLVTDENAFNLLIGIAVILIVGLLQAVLFFYKYYQVLHLEEDATSKPTSMRGSGASSGRPHTSGGNGSSGNGGSSDSSADQAHQIKVLRSQLAEQTARIRTLTTHLQSEGRGVPSTGVSGTGGSQSPIASPSFRTGTLAGKRVDGTNLSQVPTFYSPSPPPLILRATSPPLPTKSGSTSQGMSPATTATTATTSVADADVPPQVPSPMHRISLERTSSASQGMNASSLQAPIPAVASSSSSAAQGQAGENESIELQHIQVGTASQMENAELQDIDELSPTLGQE